MLSRTNLILVRVFFSHSRIALLAIQIIFLICASDQPSVTSIGGSSLLNINISTKTFATLPLHQSDTFVSETQVKTTSTLTSSSATPTTESEASTSKVSSFTVVYVLTTYSYGIENLCLEFLIYIVDKQVRTGQLPLKFGVQKQQKLILICTLGHED